MPKKQGLEHSGIKYSNATVQGQIAEVLRTVFPAVHVVTSIGVLRPFNTCQVISGMVSYPIHTVPGQASYAVYQHLVHILSPVTDNCPSHVESVK